MAGRGWLLLENIEPGASKAAVPAFTDSLRCELARSGSQVQITMVQLPAMNTPQFAVVRNRSPAT